jgi:hypothetical protein
MGKNMAYLNENQIGEITEITGEAVIIRTDGSEAPVILGMEIFEGDIVETSLEGAVNIGFIDDSSFAVSSDARVAIDEFIFDPDTEAGAQDFSVARGVFMYTSGLIGRENPDSVEIDTPVGSIGIRGTIIGGNINPDGESQVTVVEGAIVVRNNCGEQLLTSQYDTVRLTSIDAAPSNVETLSVEKVANVYGAVKNVSSELFSSFNDQMGEQGPSDDLDESSISEDVQAESEEEKTEEEVTETAAEESATQEIIEESKAEKKIELKTMDKAENAKETAVENLSRDEVVEKTAQFRSDNNIDEQVNVKLLKQIDDETFIFKVGSRVDENSPIGTVVGKVGPNREIDFNIKYELISDGNGILQIDPDTGVVTLKAQAPDFETIASSAADVQIRATRSDTGDSKVFSLHVFLNDVNDETPIDLKLSSDNASESILGIVVGELSASDADAGDILTYTLTNDPSNLFEIDGTQLKVKDSVQLDYETATSHTVTVTVTDAAGNNTEQAFTVAVSDVNEISEITGVTSNTAISEGTLANDVTVASLNFSELDVNQTTTFTTNDSRFQVSSNAGQLQLIAVSGAQFDFETESSMIVSVTQADGSNTYSNYDITVEVADLIDETPTAITLDNSTFDEDVTDGHVIATLSTSDADTGDTHTYTIQNDSSGLFEIVGDQIRLQDSTNIDYERNQSYIFDVVTTDSNGLSYTQNVALIVGNVSEVQTLSLSTDNVFDKTGNSIGLLPIGVQGAVIGTLDIETNQEYIPDDFQIIGSYVDASGVSQTLDNIFEISQNNGEFEIKIRDEYTMLNTNEIHDNNGLVGNIPVTGDNTLQIDVDLDQVPFSLTFALRSVTQISAGGAEYNINNADSIIVGTDGDDNMMLRIVDLDFKLIRGGEGYDTLNLDGFGNGALKDTFDFRTTTSNLSSDSNDLSSIEEIVISRDAFDPSNVLQMNAVDIIDLLKTSDAQINGKNVIKITSIDFNNDSDKSKVEFYDNGTKLKLSDVDIDGVSGSDFVKSNTDHIDANGHTYHVFEHDLGNVLLDTSIAEVL